MSAPGQQENLDLAVAGAETTMRELLPVLSLDADIAMLEAIAFNLRAILTPIENEIAARQRGPVDFG